MSGGLTGLKKKALFFALKHFGRKLEKPPMDAAEFAQQTPTAILVVCAYRGIAETLMTVPVLRAVRKKYPDAEITVLHRPAVHSVLNNQLHIDDLLPGLLDLRIRSLSSFIRVGLQVYKKYDLTILLKPATGSTTADILAFLSTANAVLAYACEGLFSELPFRLCNLEVPEPEEEVPFLQRNLNLLRFVGIETEDTTEKIYFTTDEMREAYDRLASQGIQETDFLLGFEISGESREHRLLLRVLVEVANHFSNTRNAKIMVIWNSTSDSLAHEFVNALPFQPMLLKDTEARKLAALLANSTLLICRDIDVLHLAASVDLPAIALVDRKASKNDLPCGNNIACLDLTQPDGGVLSPMQILQSAKKLIADHPQKSGRYLYKLDISDQALENYLQTLEPE